MATIPVNANDRLIIVVATSPGQADFDFDFLAYEQAEVGVIFTDVSAETEEDLEVVTDFTVTGLSVATGGTVTLEAGRAASVAIGDTLTIYGSTTIDRLADYQPSGDFNADTVNREQDEHVMIAQEFQRDLDRSLKVVLGSTGGTVAPGAADTVPKFDASGNLIEGPTATAIEAAEGHATAAAASAAAAALYDGVWLDDVAAVLADSALTYTVSQPGTVASGDYVLTRKENFSYEVAASGASDHHLTTAGGVKLYKRFYDTVAEFVDSTEQPRADGATVKYRDHHGTVNSAAAAGTYIANVASPTPMRIVPWAEQGGKINVLAFNAKRDFDDSDPTGLTGTDDLHAFVSAAATGMDIYVPRGRYRMPDEFEMSVDGQNMVGDGWFASRLYYTASEAAGNRLIQVNEENVGLEKIGLFNGINVGTPRDRRNIALEQDVTKGNLNLDTVYCSGFGYGFIVNGAFAHRLTVENTKEAAFWARQGGKTTISVATFSGNKTGIRLGNGEENENCLDMAFSDIVMEFGTDFQWAIDQPAAIDIQGKATGSTWNNIRLLKPYGNAIKIDNLYNEAGPTPTAAESNHFFSNIRIRQNKTSTTGISAIKVEQSKNVSFVNLDTHQAVAGGGGAGYSSAINVVDTVSYVRVANSSIGGTNESIINDSFTGQTGRISVSNTEYNKGGVVYQAGPIKMDGHINDLGNKTGNVNLTIDYGMVYKMTLTGNVTMTSIVNNASDGDLIRMVWVQDGTGGFTVSFTGTKWVAALAATSGTAGKTCTATFQYNATLAKFVQIGASSPWM